MLFSWVGKLVKKIRSPVRLYPHMERHDDSVGSSYDPNMWYRDLKKHAFGELSFAVIQANEKLEDYSQVEIGQNATFVGVYDGHGGPEASSYVCDNLFPNLIDIAEEQRLIYGETLRDAISTTEDGFLKFVGKTHEENPGIAAVGSCCLIGVIWKRRLFVGNMGDSRAIIGSVIRRGGLDEVVAEQITQDHNVCQEEVRRELKLDHQEDPQIVVSVQGVWRIKSVIQVSRAIGDAYLKSAQFAMGPEFPRLHLEKPITRPVLRTDPEIYVRELHAQDRFIVFGSDGFWEHITNQQAVEIVHNNPRSGIARRLLKSAMAEAARKVNEKYMDLRNVEKGFRRYFHDDITVIVVFIDHWLLDQNSSNNNIGYNEQVSVRGFSKLTDPFPSMFRKLQVT